MSSEQDHSGLKPMRGQFLFALVLCVVSAVLVAFLWDQTVWKKGKDLFSQARFWPAVGVIGMLVFAALHIWQLPRKTSTRADRVEAKVWLSVLEWAGWFLLYVWLVPIAGYLPVTMAIAPALAWRMGYRSKRPILLALAVGVAIVVVFKSFLQVKIPGGLIYEYFPDAFRTFFILYL